MKKSKNVPRESTKPPKKKECLGLPMKNKDYGKRKK